MAASLGDGIPAQLAALLGHPVKRIRITDETPPRVSVVDVISAMANTALVGNEPCCSVQLFKIRLFAVL